MRNNNVLTNGNNENKQSLINRYVLDSDGIISGDREKELSISEYLDELDIDENVLEDNVYGM